MLTNAHDALKWKSKVHKEARLYEKEYCCPECSNSIQCVLDRYGTGIAGWFCATYRCRYSCKRMNWIQSPYQLSLLTHKTEGGTVNDNSRDP
jgi:ribosomal protein L37AE/L43A